MQALIVQALLWAGASLIRQLFIGLGVGLASLAVILPLIQAGVDRVLSLGHSLPVSVLQILEIAGFSQALSILLSALVVKAYLVSMRKVLVGRK